MVCVWWAMYIVSCSHVVLYIHPSCMCMFRSSEWLRGDTASEIPLDPLVIKALKTFEYHCTERAAPTLISGANMGMDAWMD